MGVPCRLWTQKEGYVVQNATRVTRVREARKWSPCELEAAPGPPISVGFWEADFSFDLRYGCSSLEGVGQGWKVARTAGPSGTAPLPPHWWVVLERPQEPSDDSLVFRWPSLTTILPSTSSGHFEVHCLTEGLPPCFSACECETLNSRVYGLLPYNTSTWLGVDLASISS